MQVTTFSIDMTPPMGAPLCAGGIEPAKSVDDPQFARGMVLLGAGEPIVLATVDCVGVYGSPHDRFRAMLADAAGTTAERVILTGVHQHDSSALLADVQDVLDEFGVDLRVCDRAYGEDVMKRSAAALKQSLAMPRNVTHVGTGQARVERVASNRRVLGDDGRVAHVRWSACREPQVCAAPEGLIDPYLKAVTLFDGDKPVVTISHYATHPMSHYGKGAVSADFCGLARARRQQDDPDCFQIYTTGCAGNVTAGKYNDGTPQARIDLTDRMYAAMRAASDAVERQPFGDVAMRSVAMMLPVRETDGFDQATCEASLRSSEDDCGMLQRPSFALAWRKRASKPVDLPVLELGPATMLLLPGESFIEFQLAAQQMRPNGFVMAMAYGNGAPGYVCTDIAYEQGGYESGRPAYTGVGAERVIMDSLRGRLRSLQ